MATDSAHTWGYFFLAIDREAVVAQLGAKPYEVSEYTVDRMNTITGTPGVVIQPNTKLIRLEVAARLNASGPKPLFQGVPRHLEYTTKVQKAELASSRQPLTAGADTFAVVIPIRKTAEWWALAQDDRQMHFRERDGKPGHTAIGLSYTDRIFRKLYHARYMVETTDHDFITYFEFTRTDTTAFTDLLTKLRDMKSNPEWGYVDREYEIWMTKTK